MLIVRPTGGGKSLVYQVAGYLMKGITLFISPLLALASDQLRKLRKVSKKVEEYLDIDDETFTIDVMVLHGRQTRTQKASYVLMLCATSGVVNAGIDSRDISCAMRIEFPPSI